MGFTEKRLRNVVQELTDKYHVPRYTIVEMMLASKEAFRSNRGLDGSELEKIIEECTTPEKV